MPTPPLCAHRCAQVEGLVIDLSRARGLPERVVRIGQGMTAEYVPISGHPSRDEHPPCPHCGGICMSPWAAAECCDPPLTPEDCRTTSPDLMP